MKNAISTGMTLTLPAPAGGTISGVGYKIGNGLFALALETQTEGNPCVFDVSPTGHFGHDKATGTGVIAAGDRAYFDPATSKMTSVSTDNLEVGVFAADAGDADTVCEILKGVRTIDGPAS